MMMLQSFQPIPKGDAEAGQHTESMMVSAVTLQPLDEIRLKFPSSLQAGSTIPF